MNGTTLMPAALASCLAAGLALLPVTGCGDATGPGGCEVVYVVNQSGNPETGIRFINATDGGLEVIVEGRRITGIGSSMARGACEIYGLFADTYDVQLQQCEQDEPGSSECTGVFGPRITRRVTVSAGEIFELRVTPDFFR